MKSKLYIVWSTICLILCLTGFHSLFASESGKRLIGQKAPVISGKNAAGKGLIKLDKLMTELAYEKDEFGRFKEVNGKYVLKVTRNVVVLNFFSTSCIPCLKEIPTFNRLAEKFDDRPVKMIYVNIDADQNPLDIKRFMARKQIKVPMMLPNQKEAIKKYQAYSLPRLVVIDRKGRIERVLTGYDENLENRLTRLIEALL
ncbi:MAG: TlpA family protein disulfide reductase [Proteobacteria bacterium]|nr:TlpA family protein disulfide reductase [Pseudomonadota bacterium]